MLRQLAIHSDDRTVEEAKNNSNDLQTNNIKVAFSRSFSAQSHNKLGMVGCRTFTMANSMYNVSDFVHPRKGTMNKIVLTDGSTFTFTGTVPKGYYSLSELLTSLNSGGTTVWTGLTANDAPYFSQDPVTRLVSVTIAGTGVNTGAAFYLPNNISSTLTLEGFVGRTVATRSWVAHLLGFHNYNALTARTTQVAIRMPNMIPHQHIYFCLAHLQSTEFPDQEAQLVTSAGALACIPVDVPYGEMIVYRNDTPSMFEANDTITGRMDEMQFILVDDEGVVLQNNSAKWEATLDGELISSVPYNQARPNSGMKGGATQWLSRYANRAYD